MTRSQKGFTLIELMIVIAIIAIIAAIAIPNLLAARLSTNETAAVATLRQILASQAQFQQGARCDQDQDGTGEYGGFLDMSGAALTPASRMTSVLTPPVLSTAFQTLVAGVATRSGYNFQIWIPETAAGATGSAGAPEPFLSILGPSAVTNLRETTWCAYAWPTNYNQTGNRSFFVNQAGDILQTENPTWTGATAPPAGAGLLAGGVVLTGPSAIGTTPTGATRPWTQVN